MSSMCSRAPRCGRSSSALLAALVAGLLLLAVSSTSFAQQRVIVNPTFVQRFQRDGTAMPDYDASVPNSFCTGPGSCLRYLGDAQCLTPTNTPVDTEGCMAGWLTTDPYDGNDLFPFVQDGHIKAPTQVGIGPNLEGLSVPNGSAELNAENPGRLYQIVCLAGGETIPFSYSLGDPTSTGANSSQARFGIFVDDTTYPGTALSFVDSTVVSTPTMVSQTGTVTAPAASGLYQIGFEAIQPASGNTGNYIADVSITLKPLVDFAAPAVQITEGQSGFLLVRVNGTVPVGGISVSLQPGASTASPSDFTLGTPVAFGSSVAGSASLSSNGAGGYLLFIPEGAYDGNALSDSRNETATNPSGSVRIPISTTGDAIVESDETYSLTVESPGTNGSSPVAEWALATAASCSPSPALTATATIVDDDVDLTPVIEVEAASPSVSATAGQNVTLSFTVTSSGNAAADGTQIDDPIPPGLASFTWTCTAAGGAVCPNASGTGPISETVGMFPAGGSLTYVVTALVSASAPPTITNTVTVTPPAGGLCSGSCSVTMQVQVAQAVPAIPSLGTIGLLMLAASLAVAATLLLKR